MWITLWIAQDRHIAIFRNHNLLGFDRRAAVKKTGEKYIVFFARVWYDIDMKSFLRSFRYAGRGLALCLRERNFRCHAAVFSYMVGYLAVYDWFQLTRGEWAALLLASAFVLVAEAVNTAVEVLVDLASPGQHPLAGKAKDIAAGAVLLCALLAVAVGVVILYQPEAFRKLYAYYKENPWMLLVLGVSLAVTGAFILWPVKKDKGK